MLALTTTGSADLLALTEVSEPKPAPTEAVIRMLATSLNRGEIVRCVNSPAGWGPGWDVVGVIEREAELGGGPPVGSTVVGVIDSGAWAERVAVPVEVLAVVPFGYPKRPGGKGKKQRWTAISDVALDALTVGLDQGHVHAIERGPAYQPNRPLNRQRPAPSFICRTCYTTRHKATTSPRPAYERL